MRFGRRTIRGRTIVVAAIIIATAGLLVLKCVRQDRQLVIDARGASLPFPSAILDSLEIGISAHADTKETVTLDIDEIKLTQTPLALPEHK